MKKLILVLFVIFVPLIAWAIGSWTWTNGGYYNSTTGQMSYGTPSPTPSSTPTYVVVANRTNSYVENTPSPTPSNGEIYLKTNTPITLTSGTWLLNGSNSIYLTTAQAAITLTDSLNYFASADGDNTGAIAPSLVSGPGHFLGNQPNGNYFLANNNGSPISSIIPANVYYDTWITGGNYIYQTASAVTVYLVPEWTETTPLTHIILNTTLEAWRIGN